MKFLISTIMILLMFTLSAFGQDAAILPVVTPLPDVNLFETLASLVTGWSGMTDLMKGSAVVLILTQVVKQYTDFEYKNATAAFFSIAYAVIQMMISGDSVGAAIATALTSMGGAVVLYNSLKPVLAKVSFLSFLNLGASNE